MATVEIEVLHLGPEHNGILLTPEEFDDAEFEEGWRYELIHELLIVTTTPSRAERDPMKNSADCFAGIRKTIPRVPR